MMRILVAVSLPRQPSTGNVFRAPFDASALELALQTANARVRAVHVGPAGIREDLRVYAGMGACEFVLAAADEGADVAAILAAQAEDFGADLLLAGKRAATGLASGTVPYQAAKRLGWPIVHSVRALRTADCDILVDQALAASRVRSWRAQGALVATVGASGPRPRANAYARAREAKVEMYQADCAERSRAVDLRPARNRPRQIARPSGAPPVERLRALLSPKADGERRVLRGSPEELAEAFLAELNRLGKAPERR
jgi:electron transfer flavoprotein alpha/beta subunit